MLLPSLVAAASLVSVPPQTAGSSFLLAFPDGPRLQVDPTQGGRISSLTLSGSEFLYLEKRETNWGSTLWTAPQSAWNWPPPEATDRGRYTGVIAGDTLVLESPRDYQLNLVFQKRFLARDTDTCFVQHYLIRNAGTAPAKVSPWQVTRVLPGGLTFFPAGPGGGRGALSSQVKEISGWVWFDMDAAALPGGTPKYFSDGSGGWMAHVDRDGLLLLETFPDISAAQAAPEEAEIELYVDPGKQYMEVEHQGAYTTLAPGGSLAWTTHWYLRRIPQAAKRSPGDAALMAFVTDLTRKATTGIRPAGAVGKGMRARLRAASPVFTATGKAGPANADGRVR